MMSAVDDAFDPALGASRVGAELRAARLRLGWRLPDVAATLRIRLPYLEAIEEGRLADLPGNAYAVGFLRSYATMLGLDAAEVARRFRAEAQEVNRKPDLAFPAPVPERGVPAGAVILLGVVLAAGAYAAWYKFSGDRPTAAVVVPAVPERLAPLAGDRAAPPSNPSPQVASILPAPSAPVAPLSPMPPAPLPAAPATPVAVAPPVVVPVPVPVSPGDTSRVALRFKADAWVLVQEKQGAIVYRGTKHAGDTWPVPKGKQLLMTTGNAGGVEVLVDGLVTPSLGAVGVMRKDVPLDPDVLKAGLTPAAPNPAATPAAAAPKPKPL